MDKPPKDNKTNGNIGAPSAEPVAASAAAQAPIDTKSASGTKPQQDATTEKSWGDKYKHKALKLFRNIGVNYLVNFAISAVGTYAIIKSPANKILQKGVDKITQGAIAMGAHPKLGSFLGEFLVRTQLLLCGGHLLVPPLKAIHDHRNHLTFEVGHKLDVLQQMLGRGNEATKKNIREYKYIKDLTKAKAATLSDEDKALLAKHEIGENLQFNEKPESWKHVLKARGFGVAFTTTLSALFAVGSYYGSKDKLNKPWMDVKETYLKSFGAKYGEKFLEKPFQKIGGALKKMHIENAPGIMGELVVLELIYTAASKLGFDQMERRLLRKEELREKAEADASLARDKKFLKQAGIRQEDAADIDTLRAAATVVPATPSAFASAVSPASENRRKILEEGSKDFRAREAIKPTEPSMALS